MSDVDPCDEKQKAKDWIVDHIAYEENQIRLEKEAEDFRKKEAEERIAKADSVNALINCD